MADMILPGLYLGDWKDGSGIRVGKARPHFKSTLCVIETHPEDRYPGMTYYVPILEHDEYSLAFIPPRVSLVQLDVACEIIDDHVLNKEPLLVHCWAGMERSPLTLAYWLVRSKHQPNLDEAYKFLQSKRSIVEDRRSWLPLSLANSL